MVKKILKKMEDEMVVKYFSYYRSQALLLATLLFFSITLNIQTNPLFTRYIP